jgi:peptide/nickel transport system substrate-binding protein
MNVRSNRMLHPRWWRTLGVVSLALALAACPGQPPDMDAVVGDPEPGGTSVVGVLGDFQAFNSVSNTHLTTMEVMNYLLFTPLVRYDANLDLEPYLAESWELDEGGVTMRIRDDIVWHDGQPLTAEDVQFTFDLAKHPESASLLESAYLSMVESAQVIDPHTIRFEFAAPHSQPMEAFFWSPLPRHRLEGVAPGQLAQHPFNSQPVGSGPFRFVSWERGQSLTLEANDQFTSALGGRPRLNRLVFRVIPEATTMMTELFAGNADVICCTLLPDQGQQIDRQRGAELRHWPSREFAYIGWNNERPLFQDARVRQALVMAIDRQGIIDALLYGFGRPASGMIPPWSPMDPGLDPVPYDPDRARQLLADAGWTPGTDGTLRGPQGQPFRFTLMTNSENRLRQDIATVVQQQLSRVGVDAQLRTIEFQTMLQQHRARQYDAVISGWILDTFRVDPSPLFSCEEARRPMSANRAGYCNPEADQLIQAGLRATGDGEAREIWRQFSEILQADQPISFLFWQDDLVGVGPRIHGTEMDIRGRFRNAQEWWMPADRRR